MSKSKQAEHLWCRPLAYSWHSISPTTLVWSMAPLWKSCVWNGASHAWRVFSLHLRVQKGPMHSNTFQYYAFGCFWIHGIVMGWTKHGLYTIIWLFQVMWCFQSLVFCHSGRRNPLLHATSWRGCLHRTTALHHRSVDLPTLNRKGH